MKFAFPFVIDIQIEPAEDTFLRSSEVIYVMQEMVFQQDLQLRPFLFYCEYCDAPREGSHQWTKIICKTCQSIHLITLK